MRSKYLSDIRAYCKPAESPRIYGYATGNSARIRNACILLNPLFLSLEHQDKFHYLNQGGNSYIDDIDDSEQFRATQKALDTFGISRKLQLQLFRVLAAILHLGNIVILDSPDQSESCRIPVCCLFCLDFPISHYFCIFLGFQKTVVSNGTAVDSNAS